MMQEVNEPNLNTADESASKNLSRRNSSVNQDHPEVIMIPGRYRPMSKSRILKNVCFVDFSLFVFFLGFAALANLQSTLNAEKGLGVVSQASIYAASMSAALLLPDLMIKTFGCKKSLIISVAFSIPYIAANIYPSWETLIPAAIFLGFVAGPLTSSQAFYTNEMARRYYKGPVIEEFEVTVAIFYGINSFFSENTQIWGNLISYYVLRPNAMPVQNHTIMNCGVNFRKDDIMNVNITNTTNPDIQIPTNQQRDLLVGIYVCCGILSILTMCFFVDPLENDIAREESSKSKCESVGVRLTAAAKQARKVDQMLLFPLSTFCGLQIAFYTSDFTEAFIACSWGVHHVGFVTVCFGVCGAMMAIFIGPLVKCISQMSVILLAALLNIVTCALLFVWQPSPDVPSAYFIFAGVWGMTDAIWWSQVPALYGLMFPNDREAAFSNFYFWSFLGYFISFSYANYITVAVKINIMLAVLVIGITLYVIGQIRIKCSARSGYIPIEQSE